MPCTVVGSVVKESIRFCKTVGTETAKVNQLTYK